MRHKRPFVFAALSILTIGTCGTVAAGAENQDPLENLEYRLIGPAAGGRVSRVAGVDGDPSTYYAASASGGVWKSVNGGLEWKPIFDKQPVSSTGSIAVAPSDPNVVYVGAGEANPRGNVAEGNGIYRSTDAGKTWSHVWQQEGQIGTMAVHPHDPDIAFAAVLGSIFGPNSERGIYRTRDGGATWERVLFQDEDTGASDVAFDPANPRILFAGFWQARRFPWGMTSGGPGSGLHISRDGGDTWKRLEGKGLPEGIWGRVGVRVAPNDPSRVYAIIEAEEGGLFRSDDGGDSWTRVNASRGVRQRAWYYSTLTIDPNNAEVVWFPQVPMLKTSDGGKTIRNVQGGGWDYHDVWIDSQNSKRMIIGSDAGVSLSWDGGETWHRPALPLSQLYHINTDTQTPYRVMGTLQDYGTLSGPSNSLHGGGVHLSDWHQVGGGEAGHIAADPTDPNIVWAGEYLGFISRYDHRTGQAPHVGIFPENGSGHGVGDLRYRFQWTSPILISPHDPKAVYHAGNILFRTRDGGQTWQAMSPDLTRNDKSKQLWSGGPLTGDNTGVEFYSTIFSVAESPLEKGVVWTGSDDGLVHVTRDDGENWQDVTPPGLPEWGTVAGIEASRWDTGTAYVVVDAHRLDDETPYLWKTTDYGASWKSLTRGLDSEIYLHVVREDTQLQGMLYLGTEREVQYTLDDGASWRSLKLDMPTVAVHDLKVHHDDLVVGTMGRSIWILDDLTPVREMSQEILDSPAHLFRPLSTIRWRYASSPAGSPAGSGANPPRGALLTYFLAEEPKEEITIQILDSDGEVIRTLSSKAKPRILDETHPDVREGSKNEPDLTAKAGLNRSAWDLRIDGADEIPGAVIDIGSPRYGPLSLPGDYTVRLIVGEQSADQPLLITADPRAELDLTALSQHLDFQIKIRDQLSQIAKMVRTIRAVRDQIAARDQLLQDNPDAVDLLAMGHDLVTRLNEIEEKLHNPHAEVSYDILAGRHGGAQLYSRLCWLFEGTREHDSAPTQGMMEVGAEMTAEVEAQRAALEEILGAGVEGINKLTVEKGLPSVITR
jgi:photosystem II stability/assembly factor-like uncharacterized protein